MPFGNVIYYVFMYVIILIVHIYLGHKIYKFKIKIVNILINILYYLIYNVIYDPFYIKIIILFFMKI